MLALETWFQAQGQNRGLCLVGTELIQISLLNRNRDYVISTGRPRQADIKMQ